jgi:1-acyl-sn-glycerol-3-phosphate acyltransferase
MQYKWFSYIRAPLLVFIIPIFTLLCSIVIIFILVPFTSRKICDASIRFWGRALCSLGGLNVKVSGLENIKPGSSYVLVSNHLGLFDIPVLYSVIPLSFRMAAKAELFKIPLFGLALRLAGFFAVSRDNTEGSKAHLSKILKRFQNGESFWLAPEGTRFKGIGVGDFKLGAFFLAQKSSVPILPICIYGTQYALPKHRVLANWGKASQEVVVEILAPIMTDQAEIESESVTRHSLRDRARNQIVEAFFRIHQSNADRRQMNLK